MGEVPPAEAIAICEASEDANDQNAFCCLSELSKLHARRRQRHFPGVRQGVHPDGHGTAPFRGEPPRGIACHTGECWRGILRAVYPRGIDGVVGTRVATTIHAMRLLSILPIQVLLISSSIAHELPDDVEMLRIQRAQRIAEIDRNYCRALERLKIVYTRVGNRSAVDDIRKLIEDADPDDLPRTDEELRLFLTGTTWEFDGDRTIRFQEDGRVKKSWGVLVPKWRVEGLMVYFERKVLVFDETFTTVVEATKKDLQGVGMRVAVHGPQCVTPSTNGKGHKGSAKR